MKKLGSIKNGEKNIFPLITTRPRTMTFAEYQLLTPEQRQGEIIISDYPVPVEGDYVEVTGDGVKTHGTLLNELYAQIDSTKINVNSVLIIKSSTSDSVYTVSAIYKTEFVFTMSMTGNAADDVYIQNYHIRSNNSRVDRTEVKSSGNTFTDRTETVVSNSTKFTLYYNSTKTLDIGTLAQNCMMSDGVTSVEEKIDGIEDGWVDITSEITWHSAITYKKAIFNPTLRLIKIQMSSGEDTGIGNSAAFLTFPNKYTPRTDLMMQIGNNYYTQSDVFYIFTTSVASTSAIWCTGRFYFKSSSPRTLTLSYNVAQTAYYHQGWAEFYVE